MISVLTLHWKDWCWSWNSSNLATWCKELTRWKSPWCWERSKAGGEGGDRVWDGWMASATQWMWVWASSGSWWWTGKPGMLQGSWGLKESDMTEQLNCFLSYLLTSLFYISTFFLFFNHFLPYYLKFLFGSFSNFVSCIHLAISFFSLTFNLQSENMVDLDLYFEIYRNWLCGLLCDKFVDVSCVLEKHVTLISNVEFYMWPWYYVVQLLCRVQLFATHGLQHARLPCPSLSPGVCSKLCPLSPTVSSSVAAFFSCPQSFPASGSFPVSWLFTSGGQSIGASASTSVLPTNIQVWLVGSLCCPRSSQESSSAPQFESIDSSAVSFLYSPTLMSVHDCWKNRIFDYLDLCRQVMSLLFNMLSRFIISFLPRSKRPLISRL